jgi:hypothetical protein
MNTKGTVIMATSDIEIGISVESISDHFLISPNALHRGEDEYAGLTLHERGMLAALLTLRPGNGRQWNTSRAGINNLAPELGRDKISSILNGLHAKRYLYKRRLNMGAGRFRWEWRVFMKARPEGYDPFTTDVPTIDGTTVDGKHVNGDEQRKDDVPAGRTIDGFLVTNRPSPEEGSTLRSTRSTLRSTRSTSPLPPAPPAPAIEAAPTTGGEEKNDEETTAITDAIRHQPTWRPVAVRAAIRQAITEGLPASVTYRVIVDLAQGDTYGPTTAGPQRIIARGPWWTPGAVFVPAPPKDTKPDCERHPGQLAGSCSCCEGERRGVIPTGPTIAPATSVPEQARDLFAQIPAFQRARGRRPTAPTNR